MSVLYLLEIFCLVHFDFSSTFVAINCADRLTYPALELFDMILDIPTDLEISKLCGIYQTRICFCFLLGSLAVQLTF
jgi:hypothetical protein